MEDFSKAVTEGKADAVSAASVFHYEHCKPVDSPFMSLNEPRLRKGELIDSGNIEFINQGYAGFNDIFVEPATVQQVKAHLLESKIRVRK